MYQHVHTLFREAEAAGLTQSKGPQLLMSIKYCVTFLGGIHFPEYSH